VVRIACHRQREKVLRTIGYYVVEGESVCPYLDDQLLYIVREYIALVRQLLLFSINVLERNALDMQGRSLADAVGSKNRKVNVWGVSARRKDPKSLDTKSLRIYLSGPPST
jgi:hypothetical protein